MTDNMNIQWYPGHMTKTRRQIEADLKLVDAVCEIVDARIPVSSRNPDIDAICGEKPRMIVLNRMDLADPAATKRWAEYFKKKGMAVIATDCKTKKGISAFTPAARLACAEKLERDAKRGMSRPLRVMVVGIPNVGKSTLINQISGRKSAKAENRPGVTRGKQWVTVDSGLQLLDTPGILWPKFEDQQVGIRLACVGSIKDDILNMEELALWLIDYLRENYKGILAERYQITEEGTSVEVLEAIARARGCLKKQEELDYAKASLILFDDFRSGKMGRITLEWAPL